MWFPRRHSESQMSSTECSISIFHNTCNVKNPGAYQKMMVTKTMVGWVGDGVSVATEASWSDTGCNVKDRVPPLIRWWVTGGRKQIMLSFSSILFWQPLTNYLFALCVSLSLGPKLQPPHFHSLFWSSVIPNIMTEVMMKSWWRLKIQTFMHLDT